MSNRCLMCDLRTKTVSIVRAKELLENEPYVKDNGFWNENSKRISDTIGIPKFLMPTGIKSLGDLDIKRGINISKNNWKITSDSKISDKSRNCLVGKKIRIYPNKAQNEFFQKCFGAHRYIWNKGVDYLKDKAERVSHFAMRKSVSVTNSEVQESWLEEIPVATRDLALKSLSASYNAAITLKRRGHNTGFEMKYLDKKRPDQIFHAAGRDLKLYENSIEIFVKKLGEHKQLRMKNRSHRWIKKNFKNLGHDFSIIRETSQRYYLCIPINKTFEIKNYDKREDICAVDPGIRTFQTVYSPNSTYLLADNYIVEIRKIKARIENLTEYLKKNGTLLNSRTRNHIKRRCNLLRAKASNKVKDMHWRVASFLTRNFKTILIPKMGIMQMIGKNPFIRQDLLSLSHFRFILRLQHSAFTNGCTLVHCKESYTSKTCGKCGNIDMKLGTSKVYNCKNCDYKNVDRDINGARNIFIRSLTKLLD